MHPARLVRKSLPPAATALFAVARRAATRAVRGFGCNRRGISAVEFALTLPALLIIVGGIADVGLMCRQGAQLAAAMHAGSYYAILAGANGTSANARSAMSAASGLTGASFNANGPACYCVVTTGGTVSLSGGTPPPCSNTPCADGTLPGTYMQLTASYAYQPMMPGFSTLVATTLNESATVRLQ
jgi:Flp pilus assembly protein TadG